MCAVGYRRLAEGSLVWAAAHGLDLEARHILQFGLHSGPLPGVNEQDSTGRVSFSLSFIIILQLFSFVLFCPAK